MGDKATLLREADEAFTELRRAVEEGVQREEVARVELGLLRGRRHPRIVRV